MTMIDYTASGRNFTPAIARWCAQYCQRLISSMHPLLLRGEGLAFQSPYVLERRIRQNIELHQERGEQKPYWQLSHSTVGAICDSVLQVRNVVARYCHTESHLEDTCPSSALYQSFRANNIAFPREPY